MFAFYCHVILVVIVLVVALNWTYMKACIVGLLIHDKFHLNNISIHIVMYMQWQYHTI